VAGFARERGCDGGNFRNRLNNRGYLALPVTGIFQSREAVNRKGRAADDILKDHFDSREAT
jgi:hypothetical protein